MNQPELLKYAIAGLEAEREKIDQLLSELRSQGSGSSATVSRRPAAPKAGAGKARVISDAGRAAIRAALKRRWAAYHAGKGAAPNASKKAPKKRVLSPAQLAAMRKNAAKARAAAQAKQGGR